MNINFFKETRILDGGMGQELLARGMKPNGTLWSANAILNSDYHKLLEDTHKDFVKAGAEVIVTTTFTTRRKRLRDNNIEDKFEYLNKKAGEIAVNVKKDFPNIKIAGGLPPQHLTYEEDRRSEAEITKDFNEQARLLNEYVDFYYFDVWSSIKEFKCGIEAIKELNKPYLVGIHISEGTKLPSGEKISEIKNILDDNLLGVMLSCVSPENYELNLEELKKLNVPFGFKLNGFKTTKPKNGYTANYLKTKGNPNEFLGHREDFTPEKIQEIAKKFKEHGATIIGGCCETRPSHIEAMAKIK
ncbi:homocysteine S-methyltransferase family protein [Candidatus Pelagibacter communis]|jgi:homocysteine S-methyltransferase|uniref:homocysteine S-methyltransferase family protein n=1 Tax=Pelagibacter ubique TaxID=198252 RepID=UPI00092D0E1F|nr:homocysteine S-methyltransferase family protein [Candidatus Pelagibacter ubique]